MGVFSKILEGLEKNCGPEGWVGWYYPTLVPCNIWIVTILPSPIMEELSPFPTKWPQSLWLPTYTQIELELPVPSQLEQKYVNRDSLLYE